MFYIILYVHSVVFYCWGQVKQDNPLLLQKQNLGIIMRCEIL